MRSIYKGLHSLLWLIPITYGIAVMAVLLSPLVFPGFLSKHETALLPFAAPACLVSPFGGFWAIYQCIRYEKFKRRYIAVVALIPLGFAWYYLERYRPRVRKSDVPIGERSGASSE